MADTTRKLRPRPADRCSGLSLVFCLTIVLTRSMPVTDYDIVDVKMHYYEIKYGMFDLTNVRNVLS